MGRLLAGLALIAVCAGLVWLWGGSERGARERTARTENPAGSSPARAEELSPAARAEEPGSGELQAVESPTEARTAPATREELARTADTAEARAGDLVVEVVDPSGTPRAGIPLQIGQSQPGNGGDWSKVQEHGTLEFSDAAGRVVFAGLRSRIASEGSSLLLCADLPFDEPPQLWLDASVLAAPIVRFPLPPGGRLAVVVSELDGSRAPAGSKLRIQLLKPEEFHEPDLSGPQWTWPLVEGAFHIPWVELGRDWELAAWRPKGKEPTRERVRGPSAMSELVELELVLGSDHPVVSFRVLDPTGSPLARSELELARSSLFGALDRSQLTTDAEGRFTLDGSVNFFEGGAFSVTHRPAEGEPWMGRASLPGDPAPGWHDGGDIRLTAEPLLVAGRVVDARGTPVAGAEVLVGRESRWTWGEAAVIRGKCDERGAFELRGMWAEEAFPLHARAETWRSPEQEVRQGARDVVLVLTPRHTLSGELLVDEGVDPGALHFALEGPDGARSGLERKQGFGFVPLSLLGEAVTRPPGHFELEPIEGGTFDLLFLLEDVELTRLTGLVVHADLELGVVDLRGRIATCELELVGGDDTGEIAGEYTWWPSGSEQRRSGSFGGRLVRIQSARMPIDVELRPRGYRLALLEQLSGRRQHRLTAPLEVRLVLRTSGTLPPPPYRFDGELYSGGSSVSQPSGARWFTPERREIECLVSTAGRLELRWHLERKVEGEGFGGAIGAHVLEPHWITLEVQDVPGVQVFEVELEAAALDGLVTDPPF